MAVFPSFNLTKKGEELLNRSIGEGRVLTFTKFKIGDGVPTEDWRDLVNVQSSFKEFSVLETAIQADQVLRIRGYFDNKGFAIDKQFKEIGVFVTLDGVAGEYLYSYTNAGDTGDIIPAESRGFYSRTLDVSNYIGYATNITFNIEQTRDNYDFNTENELKVATFLKKGDKARLWGRLVLGDIETLNYIVTDEATSLTLNNGLYCKLAGDNTVSNIKTDLVNLKGAVVGDVVEVLGFHKKGDGAHHKRIAKAVDDGSGEQGQNGIWWCIVHNGEVNVSWFGAKGDDSTFDNFDILQNIVNFYSRIYIPIGDFYLSDTVVLNSDKFSSYTIKGFGGGDSYQSTDYKSGYSPGSSFYSNKDIFKIPVKYPFSNLDIRGINCYQIAKNEDKKAIYLVNFYNVDNHQSKNLVLDNINLNKFGLLRTENGGGLETNLGYVRASRIYSYRALNIFDLDETTTTIFDVSHSLFHGSLVFVKSNTSFYANFSDVAFEGGGKVFELGRFASKISFKNTYFENLGTGSGVDDFDIFDYADTLVPVIYVDGDTVFTKIPYINLKGKNMIVKGSASEKCVFKNACILLDDAVSDVQLTGNSICYFKPEGVKYKKQEFGTFFKIPILQNFEAKNGISESKTSVYGKNVSTPLLNESITSPEPLKFSFFFNLDTAYLGLTTRTLGFSGLKLGNNFQSNNGLYGCVITQEASTSNCTIEVYSDSSNYAIVEPLKTGETVRQSCYGANSKLLTEKHTLAPNEVLNLNRTLINNLDAYKRLKTIVSANGELIEIRSNMTRGTGNAYSINKIYGVSEVKIETTPAHLDNVPFDLTNKDVSKTFTIDYYIDG